VDTTTSHIRKRFQQIFRVVASMEESHFLASRQPEIPATMLMKGLVKLAGLDANGGRATGR
jgi:hypothetical protein